MFVLRYEAGVYPIVIVISGLAQETLRRLSGPFARTSDPQLARDVQSSVAAASPLNLLANQASVSSIYNN
jgi:hypothetical protein